jgi:hypothetical protein
MSPTADFARLILQTEAEDRANENPGKSADRSWFWSLARRLRGGPIRTAPGLCSGPGSSGGGAPRAGVLSELRWRVRPEKSGRAFLVTN